MSPRAAAAVMRRQAGVVSRAQAAEAGLSDRQVHRLVSAGEWTRLLPGIYLSAESSLSWHTWAHAALLAAGPGAALVGETAAALRDLVPKTLPITVAIPAQRRCRWRSTNINVVRLDVPARECVTIDGLRTTTRLRTAVDVAHLLPIPTAQRVLDRMLVLEHVVLDALTDSIATSRRTGSARARRLMASANDLAAAESERMARRLFRDAGLTGWVSNHPVAVPGRELKVDLALRRLRIAVEIKGWTFHSLIDRATKDDQRVADLSIAGWIVIPVGWLELVTNPEGVVARVRAAIAAREVETA